MKKKVLLVLMFISFVACAVLMSNGNAEAKTYKRKIIDNWEFKSVKCYYDDDVQLKVPKKMKYTFGTDNLNIFNIDEKGHVTFKTIGAGCVYAISPTGQKYECVIKVLPHELKVDNITIKVGETVTPQLNFGNAPLPEKIYYNMNTAYNYYKDIVEYKRQPNNTYTITGLEPGTVTMTVGAYNCYTSFDVTVVE